MIELRTFGQPELVAGGKPLEDLVGQSKRLAVLITVAIGNGGNGVGREWLLPLFWPELDEGRARRALNQSLYSLRNALGDGVIVTTGRNRLTVDRPRLHCDVVEFRRALVEERFADAMQLYSAPFLDGFHLNGAGGFGRWVDATRDELASEAVRACWSLASSAEQQDQLDDVVSWGERAVGLAPLDERHVSRLVEVLLRIGDDNGAIRVFDAFAHRLEHECELTPSQQLTAQVNELRGGRTSSHRASEPVFAPQQRLNTEANSQRIPRLRNHWDSLAIASASALLGLTIGLLFSPLGHSRSAPVLRYEIPLSDDRLLAQLPGRIGSRLAISRDGALVAYVGVGANGPQLWIHNRSSGEVRPVEGTDGAVGPAWSRDGRQIAFFSKGSWKSISATSNAPATVLADSGVGRGGGSWGSDGSLYVDGIGGVSGITRIDPSTGGLTHISAVDTAAGERSHLWPHALPNDHGLLYTVSMGGARIDEWVINALNIENGTTNTLVTGVRGWFADGRLIYVTAEGALLTAPFDTRRLTITGVPTAVLDGVRIANNGSIDLDISDHGTLIFSTGIGADRQLIRFARDGTADLIDPAWPRRGWYLALSPDGDRVAVEVGGNRPQIWLKPLDGGPAEKLTFVGSSNGRPVWSPDGRSVTFISNRAGPENRSIFSKSLVGLQPAEMVLRGAPRIDEANYSPDGRWLLYRSGGGSTDDDRDLFAVDLDNPTAQPLPLATSPFNETSPTLSPDGRWLAFASDSSGEYEIYVRPFPDVSNGLWKVSEAGGVEPVWAHRHQELFYKNGNNELVAVSYISNDGFVVAGRDVLFPLGNIARLWQHQSYAITSDDQSFIMLRPRSPPDATKLLVIENWFEELTAR